MSASAQGHGALPTSLRIVVQADSSSAFARVGEPVTVSVPLPRGAITDTAGWRLTCDGAPLPLQTQVLERWSDGTIRWALVDTQVSLLAGAQNMELALAFAGGDQAPAVFQQIRIIERGGRTEVDTGATQFAFSDRAAAWFADVQCGGHAVLDSARSLLRVVLPTGSTVPVTWRPTIVETNGPVRSVLTARGEATVRTGSVPLVVEARAHFFAGLSAVRLQLTMQNPAAAAHPGGFWELGDAGSALLKEFSLVLAPASSLPALHASIESQDWETAAHRIHVYQDSSGGENWASTNHVTRTGALGMSFRGYRGTRDDVPVAGMRATPIVTIDDGERSLGAAVPAFWQNFPRAIEATPESLTIAFFPSESACLHELQGGEQKTHECYLIFGDDRVTERPLEWCRSGLVAAMHPEWYAQSSAIRYLTPAAEADPVHRTLVAAAVDGDDTFFAKRERIDEYGWRSFGELYGDHEAVRQPTSPLVSHYNNQYDVIAGFAIQFMRTGDPRWWRLCDELAVHVKDVDIYNTDRDAAKYNRGLFWHTIHYIDAGKSTHRSYPRAAGSNGGGPSCEHNYTTGLLLHYLLTGDTTSRDAAVGLSQFVIDMDDGQKTVFRWLARGDTGRASASRSEDYHGPGRGSGNSVNALVDGHRVTGDRRFLDKAEHLIRRCTHPRQDIERLNLLDPENRWFYTMYLQSLGKYLDWKVERDELDAMYAYGREVLLHFARWMADHERPYFDRPDLLEFPTETWPAQDIRKSEVFDHAARHATPNEIPRLTERAAFFFRSSVDTLTAMPTRTLARPVVLMLVHGMLRAHANVHGIVAAPVPREESTRWPAQQPFVPQKARAKRRLKQIVVAGIVVVLTALLVYVIT